MRILYLAAFLVLAAPARAQEPTPVPAQAWDMVTDADSTQVLPEEVVRRRVEMLLRNGRREEAVELLESRQARQELEPSLRRRLARLYDQLSRFEDLEALLEPTLEGPGEPTLADLRMLAEARLALDKDEAADAVLDRILARDREDPGLLRLAATMLGHADREGDAIALLEEGRQRLRMPLEFSQQLGSLHAERGAWADAVREYLNVIVMNPLNVSLIRGQILDLVDGAGSIGPILEEAEAHVSRHATVPQLGLVLAELRQRNGDPEGAWEVLAPLVGDETFLQDLLQMAMAGLADSRLPDADPEETLSSLQLSARVLRGLLTHEALPGSLAPRIYDALSRTLLAILSNRAFEGLSGEERLAVLEESRRSVISMHRRFPTHQLTASALLRLAGIYVDSLHRAEEAIDLYRRLQMDPNAPRDQVRLARVGLGRAYVAAGDTAAARELFTDMGRDRSFEEGQARAHYHLGLLDFMGGHFQTAQERFSSVALDAPTAEFTNDSLDLAMLLAEQRMTGAPDEAGLSRYGRALYHRATFQPDSLEVELRALTGSDTAGLSQRAHLDLARHYRDAGRPTDALRVLEDLVRNSAFSRYAAAGLDLKGELLEERGDVVGAREAYTAVLLEHENYVYIDSVRDKLRQLPGDAEAEGDLP